MPRVKVSCARFGTGSRPVGRRPATGHRTDLSRWRAVTVYVEYGTGKAEIPQPLARLGDAVEVRTQPAPGGKGTEIHARLTGTGPDDLDGQEPLEVLRKALRESKQVLEVGWVLEADHNRTSQPTPLNKPLRDTTSHAMGEGRV